MQTLEKTEHDLRLIMSRNIIFPEDQIKIMNLIKNEQLVCDHGSFSLKTIEDRNLIFPQDVTTLRQLVQTINTCDDSFKTLMELFIASAKKDATDGHKHEVIEKNGNKYYKDPVDYTDTKVINGTTIKLKSRPGYKKIYQDELFLDQSGTLLNQLCGVASFKTRNSDEYGMRLYFDSELLKLTTPIKRVITSKAEIPEETKSKDEYEVLMNQLQRKVTKCGNEYLDQWNSLFENSGSADMAYNLLNILKDKPWIEVVSIETDGKQVDIPKIIEEHVKDDVRIINKTKPVEGTALDSIIGFFRNMVGGGDSQTDHQEYTNMKNRYKHEKASIIHQLLH